MYLKCQASIKRVSVKRVIKDHSKETFNKIHITVLQSIQDYKH